ARRGSMAGELGMCLESEAPGLVVREVQVQRVELEVCGPLDEAFDDLHALKVARDVEHDASMGEARGVTDVDEGEEIAFGVAGDELAQRALAVERAGGGGGVDTDAVGVDAQAIALLRRVAPGMSCACQHGARF